jgi:mRNA-degrading endonuclease RelE of RelBE toxin-antitoxin system
MSLHYSNTKEFAKDLKRLLKKYSTLEEDLETAKKNAIELLHIHNIDNRSVELIPKYCRNEVKLCKIKKFSCKALKGKGCQSGIRVIYAFFPQESKVEFVEIYFKGNKANMDYERAGEYLESF